MNSLTDWRVFKLSELFDFIPTGSHSRDAMTHSAGVNPVFNIHYGDIHTKYDTYVDLSIDAVPSLIDSSGARDAMFLQEGDVVVADASEDYAGVGNAIEIVNSGGKRCIAGLHTFALRAKPETVAPGYGALIFKHAELHRHLMRVSTYSKVYGVTKASFNEVSVTLPPLEDQVCIVDLLKSWDQYTASIGLKIQAIQNIRKALIKDIFTNQMKSQTGVFARCNKTKLSEIADFRNGKPFEDAVDAEGKYNLITIDSIDIDGHLKSKHKRVNRTDSSLIKDDLVIVLSDIAHGLLLGLCDLIHEDDKYVLNQRMGRLRIKSKDLPEFVRFSINANQLHFRKRAQGTSQRHIYERDVMALEIGLPPLDIQRRIADLLTTIDKEIVVLQKKEHAISTQKLYLQNGLITGKIIVPDGLRPAIKEAAHA